MSVLSFVNDARISYDTWLEKIPPLSTAFMRRIDQNVDFGDSEYARAAMNQLGTIPHRPSREGEFRYAICLGNHTHYYKHANVIRHLCNILFVSMLPSRPPFEEAHSTIRELVLLAFCHDQAVASQVLNKRWPTASPYIRIIHFAPSIHISELDVLDLVAILRDVDNSASFCVNNSTALVLAIRAVYYKAIQAEEAHGMQYEYVERFFDILLVYMCTVDEPPDPSGDKTLVEMTATKYTWCHGVDPTLNRLWSEICQFVKSKEGHSWHRVAHNVKYLLYKISAGIARVFSFMARGGAYSHFNTSQGHSQQEVSLGRDFALAYMILEHIKVAETRRNTQIVAQTKADFFSVERLFDEQVFHFLDRSFAHGVRKSTVMYSQGVAWVLVRGVSAVRMKAIIGASMSASTFKNLIVYVGQMYDTHIGSGAVVGLRCWYDGEEAKTDAICLFSLAITVTTRACDFRFPGYSVPVYPFVARLLLNMPMAADWLPISLALGVLPQFSKMRFAAGSQQDLKNLLTTLGVCLFLHTEAPDKIPLAKVASFFARLVWHSASRATHGLIVLHEDMTVLSHAMKATCMASKDARTHLADFFRFLNQSRKEGDQCGYTKLGKWASVITDLGSWFAVARGCFANVPTPVSEKVYKRQIRLATKAMGVFMRVVREMPQRATSTSQTPATPRQTKLGTQPYEVGSNRSNLMSPLVRRSRTPTLQRGPFKAFNPDIAPDLLQPFGQVIGYLEYMEMLQTGGGDDLNCHFNDGGHDAFDVRRARIELMLMHQTALHMESPLTSIGLPVDGSLDPAFNDNPYRFAVPIDAFAAAERHRSFRVAVINVQATRNRETWNNYGSLEDLFGKGDVSVGSLSADPVPPKLRVQIPKVPTSPKSTIETIVAAAATQIDMFNSSGEDDSGNESDWETTKVIGSPVFASKPVPKATLPPLQLPDASKKKRKWGGDTKRHQKHKRPNLSRLSDRERRDVAEGRLKTSTPLTLGAVASVAGEHHRPSFRME